MNDPLDDLLTPSRVIPNEPLRRDLFGRTARALRWRKHRRRLVVAAGVAALLALTVIPPPEEPIAPPARVADAAPPPTPVALEWRALDQPAEAAALYREAGDRYLESGCASDAVRCYANAIDESRSLDVNTDDSWLLIAIKHARKKELNP